MKARMRFAAILAIILSLGIVLGLGYAALLTHEKQNTGADPTYHIVTLDDYEVFPGDTFYLAPTLVSDQGERTEGVFSYISDNKGVVVDEDGKVTVEENAEEAQVHITVTEHKTQTKQEVSLHVLNALSDVYRLSRNGEELSPTDTESYQLGASYSYTVSTIPEKINLERYVSVECRIDGRALPNIIDYSVSQNVITFTPKAIGKGEIEIKIQNASRGVDFTQTFSFESSFEDAALTKSALQDKTFLDAAALNRITELELDGSVSSVSFNGIEEGLPALRRIVLRADTVVKVTSPFPNRKISYRVPESVYGQYLEDAVWGRVETSVIPYFSDPHEVVVVYHTDDAHETAWGKNYKAELFGGTFSSCESAGYELDGWQTKDGRKVTEAAMASEGDGIHLYALWNAKKYTVTFENFADQVKKTLEVTYLEAVGSLEEVEPHAPGWEFVGWFFDRAYERPFTETTVYSAQGDITVYAKYTTRIKLDYDGLERSGDLKETAELVYNSEIRLPTVSGARDGWTFLGWFTARGGHSEDKSAKQILSGTPFTEMLEDQTLYAVWQTELAYDYDRTNFSMLGWDVYHYVRGDSIAQSDAVTGDHLRTSEDLAGVLEGWEVGGLFYGQGEELLPSNDEIRLNADDVIRVVFSTTFTIRYGHDGTRTHEEKADYGTDFELFREAWGTAPDSYGESSVLYEIGYTFHHFADISGETVVDGTIPVDMDHAMTEYTAKYTAVEYQIVFDVSVFGDRVTSAPASLVYSDPDRAGKLLPEFEGELSQKGFTGNWLYEETAVGRTAEGMWTGTWDVPAGVFGDITLKAELTRNAYTVTLIGHNGQPVKDGQGNDITIPVQYGEGIDSGRLNLAQDRAEAAAPTGYAFAGWFLSSEDRGTQWTDETKYDFDQDINLYAKFRMGITFDMRINVTLDLPEGFTQNGNKGLSYTVYYGEALPLPLLQDNRAIWTFLGWRADETVSADVISGEDGAHATEISTYTSTENCYYAVWTQEISLEIPYGGENIRPHKDRFTVYYGATTFKNLCELNQMNDLFTDGFFDFAGGGTAWSFEGWYPDETFDGKIDPDSGYSMDDYDYSQHRIGAIYARFTSSVNFTFKEQSVTQQKVTLDKGLKELFESVEQECQITLGYELEWTLSEQQLYRLKNIAATETVPYAFGNATLSAEEVPITYYVEFDANGDYDPDGGENKQTRGPFAYDSAVAHPELFNRDGYLFSGWEFEGKVYSVEEEMKNLTAEDGATVVVKANWTPITYTVEYDPNGGDGEMAPETFTYDTPQELHENTYARRGYRFSGWEFNGETYVDCAEVQNLTTENEGTVTLKAKWEPIQYFAVYRLGFGEDQRVTVTYGDENDVFWSVDRFGYDLDGWIYNGVTYAAGDQFPDLTEEDQADIVLTAKWSARRFTIRYQDESRAIDELVEYTLDDWQLEGATYEIQRGDNSVFQTHLLSATGFYERSVYKPSLNRFSSADGRANGDSGIFYWDLSDLAKRLRDAMMGVEGAEDDLSEVTVLLSSAKQSYTISFVYGDTTVKTFVYTEDDIETLKEELGKNLPPVPQKIGYESSAWDIDALFDDQPFVPGNYSVFVKFTPYVYTLELYDETGESGTLLATIADFTFDCGAITLPAESQAYALRDFLSWDLSVANLEKHVPTAGGSSTIKISASLRPYFVKTIENGSYRETVYTYRDLLCEEGEYFFDLTQEFSGCRVAVGDCAYAEFTVYAPGEAKVPFKGENILAVALAEGESLYVYDANGGNLYDSVSGTYSDRTIVVSKGQPQKFSGGNGVYFSDHVFEEWEESDPNGVVKFTAVWKEAEEKPAPTTITLRFQTEEAYHPDDITVTLGETVALPQLLKAGYIFKGWIYNGEVYQTEFDTNQLADALPEGNIVTLVAQWKEIEYTVLFYDGFSEESIFQKSYTYTQKFEIPQDVANIKPSGSSNYTLRYWYDESGRAFDMGIEYDALTTHDGAQVVLTAQWDSTTETNYYIYYMDAYSYKEPNTDFPKAYHMICRTDVTAIKNGTDGGSSIHLYIPQRAGYEFTGWYLNTSNTKIDYDIDKDTFDNFFPQGNYCYLYARAGSWQEIDYTVTFRFNEDKTLHRSVTNQTVVLPEDLTAPTRYGYTVHWTVPEFNYCNVVVYPEYVPISYRVVYSAEGATSVPETKTVTYGNSTLTFDSAEREGKVLVGWSYGGTIYPAGSVIPNLTGRDENITVTAVWRDYEIRFVDENGTLFVTMPRSEELLQAITGHAAYVSGIDLPSREGYRIVWEIEEGQTGDVQVLLRYVPIVFYLEYYAGPSESEPIEVVACAYGAEIRYLSRQKEGYLLKAWRDDAQRTYYAGSRVDWFGDSALTIRLTAEWEAITYYVEYDANGGNTVPARQTVRYGEKGIVFPEIARRGYILQGWVADGVGGELFSVGSPIRNLTSEDGAVVRLKAKWEAIEYHINYDTGCDEITVGGDATFSASYDGEAFALPVLSGRAGYEFVGWNCRGSLLKGNVRNLSAEEADTVTLHAVWNAIEYKILYYKSADGVLWQQDNWTVKLGASYQMRQPDVGYTWSKSPDHLEPYTLKPEEFDAEKTLKLYEVGVSLTYYFTIGYCLDGGNAANTTQTVEIDVNASQEEFKFNLLEVPYRLGYIGEWTIDPELNDLKEGDGRLEKGEDSTITLIVSKAYLSSGKPIVVTAVYTPITYTVTFDGAGGHWTSENGAEDSRSFESIKYDEELGEERLSTVGIERTGYVFLGWKNAASADGYVKKFVNLTSVNGDIVVLVAVWSPIEYTVYLYDGLSDDLNEETKLTKDCTYNVAFKLGEDYTFSRDGYRLIGWQKVDDPDVQFAYGETVINLTAEDKVIIRFKAIWAPNQYTVWYHSDGEIVSTATIYYGDKISTPPTLHKVGYEVSFWVTEENADTEDKMFHLDDPITDNIHLYAVWKPIEFTVYFDAGEGSADETSCAHTYGTEDDFFPDATRDGYDLVGWEYHGHCYAAGDAIPDFLSERGEITVQAVWTPTVYTVKFYVEDELVGVATFTVEDESIEYPPLPEGYDSWKITDEEGNTFRATAEKERIYAVYYTENHVLIASRDVTGLSEEEIKTLLPVPERVGYFGAWDLSMDGDNYIALPVYTAIEYRITFLDWEDKPYAESSYTVENYHFKSPAVPEYHCRHNDASHADRYITYWERKDLTYGDVIIKPIAEARVYQVEFRYFETPDNYYQYIANGSGSYQSFTLSYRDDCYFILPEIPEIPVGSESDFVFESKSWYTTIDTVYSEVRNDNVQEKLLYQEGEPTVFFAWFATNSYYIQFINKGLDGSESELFGGQLFQVKYGITVEPNEVAAAEEAQNHHPTGYTFLSWYMILDDGETTIEVVYGAAKEGQISINTLTEEKRTEEAPIKIYTRWRPNKYTVEFHTEKGSDLSTLTVNYDDNNTAVGVTKRTGYTFVQWNAEANGVSFTVAESGKIGEAIRALAPENVPDDGTTISLTAQWTPITYTVKYNAAGGNSTPSTQTVTYDTTERVAGAISRTGYTFGGWKSSKDGKTYQPNAEIRNWTSQHEEITLTAVWTGISYKVTFNSNGGNNPSFTEKNVTFGSQYGSLPTVTRSSTGGWFWKKNYTFTGWYTSASGGQKIETGTTVSIANNHTLYAHWQESCIAAGSQISLANGRVTAVENLKCGDEVLVFNHETGTFDTSAVTYIEHNGFNYFETVTLYFERGISVKVVGQHGFFDVYSREYIQISSENVDELVGHTFLNTEYSGGEYKVDKVKLLDYKVQIEYLESYSFVTAKHLNHFVNGMLGMASEIDERLYNIFELDENFKYDEEKMAADIDKYGLYEYADLAEYIPYEMYRDYPIAYLKVVVGKGYMTYDEIVEYVPKFRN